MRAGMPRCGILTKMLGLLFIVLIPSNAAIVYLNTTLREHSAQDALDTMDRTVRSIEMYQRMLVSEVMETLFVLRTVQGEGLFRRDPQELHQILELIVSRKDYISNILITDRHGEITAASTGIPRNHNVQYRAYFRKALASGRFSAGEYVIEGLSGKPGLHFADVIRNRRGEPAGVVAASIDLTRYSEVFRDVAVPADASVGIFDRHGVRILRHPHPTEASRVGEALREGLFRRLQQGPARGHLEDKNSDGQDTVYAYSRFTLLEDDVPYLYLVMELPKASFTEAMDRTAAVAYGLSGLAVLASFLGGWALYRRVLVDRLVLLEGMMDRFTAGQPCRLPENFGDDELGRLGVSLTTMMSVVREKDDQLEASANSDCLTGLFNRRKFNEDLEMEILRARRYGHDMAFLIIDIDYFKLVNDTHGHLAGDEVLRQVAEVTQCTLRETDLVYRFGGEEFAALLPEASGGVALAVAEKVRRAVEEHEVFFKGANLRVTISVGVASLVGVSQDARELYHRADTALYAAKSAGRNRCMLGGVE